jgi:hypothetical protein
VQIYAMNFFSHYYLDKENTDKWFLFGTLLPELLPHFNEKMRKAVSDYTTINPVKVHESIYKGIQRHYEVDRHFHNSTFFKEKTAIIKKGVLENQHLQPVHYRTFYLAHIWLELMIDRVLIKNDNGALVERFYDFMETLEEQEIERYFAIIGKPEIFNDFKQTFERHKRIKYLFYYVDNEKFVGALLRLYSNINPSIFDMNVNTELAKLLALTEQEMQSEILKFVNEFKKSLTQPTA